MKLNRYYLGLLILCSCQTDSLPNTPNVSLPVNMGETTSFGRSVSPLDAKYLFTCPNKGFYVWESFLIDQAGRFSFKTKNVRVSQKSENKRIFSENLEALGFSHPFKWSKISLTKASNKSLEIFSPRHSYFDSKTVIAIGLLKPSLGRISFKTSPNTKIKSFDSLFSETDLEGDSFSSIKVNPSSMQHEGPQQTASGFIFLRPKDKNKFNSFKLSFNPQARGSFAIAIARLNCSSKECNGIQRVNYFQKGQFESTLLQQSSGILANPDQPSLNSGFYVGRGGSVELDLDGFQINRNGPDIKVHLIPKQCTNNEKYKVFAKARRSDSWMLLHKHDLCGTQSIDLGDEAYIRFIKIVDASHRESSNGIQIQNISCLN